MQQRRIITEAIMKTCSSLQNAVSNIDETGNCNNLLNELHALEEKITKEDTPQEERKVISALIVIYKNLFNALSQIKTFIQLLF